MGVGGGNEDILKSHATFSFFEPKLLKNESLHSTPPTNVAAWGTNIAANEDTENTMIWAQEPNAIYPSFVWYGAVPPPPPTLLFSQWLQRRVRYLGS